MPNEVKRVENNGRHWLCVYELFHNSACGDDMPKCQQCPYGNTVLMGDDNTDIPEDATLILMDDGTVRLEKAAHS